MIPLSEITSRVRTKFEAESTTKWENQGIYDAINEGLDELSEQTLFYERYVTIPINPDQTYYDLRGYLPETIIGVTSVWSTVRGDWLTPIEEDDLGFKWEESTGDPQMFWLRGIYWLGVWPKGSSTSTGYLRVHFAGMAPRFSTPQDVLSDLPDDLVPALEEYALYELNAQDRETERSLAHWEKYQKMEKQLGDFIDKRIVRAKHGVLGGRR